MWENIKNYIVNGDEILCLLNALYAIGGFLIGLVIKKISTAYNIYRFKKVLSFRDNNCVVSIPVYKRELYSEKVNVVIFSEMVLQHKLLRFLHRTGVNAEAYVQEKDATDGNEIHIGGPIANLILF